MISWCWAVWFFSTIMVMIGSSWFHVLHPHLSCRLIRSISSGSSFKISLKWPHFTSPASLWHHRSAKASASPPLPIYSPLSCTLLNITVSCQLPPCLADFPITPPLYTCPLHNKVGLTASTAPSLLHGPSPNSTMTDAGPHIWLRTLCYADHHLSATVWDSWGSIVCEE